jgi:hypothetical protein
MGQQQLLLLVLATVIVGLAVVQGIASFNQSRRQAAADQMVQTAMDIATDIQAYAGKPAIFKSQNSTGENRFQIDFGELPYYDPVREDPWDGDYVDNIAAYSLNGHSTLSDDYNPGACPHTESDPLNTVEAYSREYDISVCVTILGGGGDDLDAGMVMGQ